jgi:phosphopantetheine adenylyltransferase/dephospho-CoA kinase
MRGFSAQANTNLIIGLTGGIASGKSTAASTLADWGAHVIDADKLGHRAYLRGTAAFDAVIAAFGEDTIGEDGEVDRRVLGGKVFGNPDKLKQLTDIAWPAIRELARQEIEKVRQDSPEQVVVLEAAVLLEAGWQDLVDQIWVVVVDPEVAIARASARDGVDAAAVQARIDAQMSNAERIGAADRVIDNSGDAEQLTASLKAAWAELGGATA